MKRLVNKYKNLSVVKKAELFFALVLTLCFLIALPVYGWFNGQRKAAELYKIEYPNSLYINAAHREDRIFFNLDEIDVNEFKVDEFNHPIQVNGQYQFIDKKQYIFTVSGEGIKGYTLQVAHTNNNHFTYTVYEATELDPSQAASADVTYDIHLLGNRPENEIDFSDDLADSARVAGGVAYYSKGAAVSGRYLNLVDESDTTCAILDTSDTYFARTYASNDNVQVDSVPTYWQANIALSRSDIDSNHKRFCKYYILEVTWPSTATNNKETDLIYIGVSRNSN